MRWVVSVVTLVAAACGSVDERSACAASTDCPVGEYCAQTPDGAVCWPDANPPSVSSVTLACSTAPCVRDAVLHVEATVTDDAEVLDASVSLDLGGPAVAMSSSGGKWVADLPLRGFPFPDFERAVTATVTARDGARNASALAPGPPQAVTRLRWTYDAGVPMTPAAVMSDGTVVVGLSSTSDQVLAVAADGTKAWSLTVGGTSFVTAAPAIGERAIWVGSEDFLIRGVKPDGTAALTDVGVNTDGAVRGSLAVLPGTTKEWSFGASASGRVAAASTVPLEDPKSTASSAYASGPVVTSDGRVCAASAAAAATLRCYTFDGAFAEDWAVGVGVNVTAPPAVDADDNVWTGSQDAKLDRTTPAGATETMATLAGSVADSPVVLAGGDVVVGDGSGTLHRVTSAKTVVWSRKLNGDPLVDEPLLAPLVLTGSTATFVVPTRSGVIYALDSDGWEVWRGALTAGAELRAGNVFTAPGQAGSVTSTAYFSSASGKLFAVVVDGRLDASAPWPKAFHDPRNTSRAGPQP